MITDLPGIRQRATRILRSTASTSMKERGCGKIRIRWKHPNRARASSDGSYALGTLGLCGLQSIRRGLPSYASFPCVERIEMRLHIMTAPMLSAKEFDYLFDNGMDTTAFTDSSLIQDDSRFTSTQHVDFAMQRWLWIDLSVEAESRGVTLDALMESWLGDRLKEERNRKAQTMVSIALRDPERMQRWIDARVAEVRQDEEEAFAHAQKTLTPQDIAPLLSKEQQGQQHA